MNVKVDASKYAEIKKAASAGIALATIAETVGVSCSTVYRVKQSKSLEDYRSTCNENNKRYAVRHTVNRRIAKYNNTMSSFQTVRQIQLLEELNATMKLISNKLSFIVDELV